jgi:hypothetical protein
MGRRPVPVEVEVLITVETDEEFVAAREERDVDEYQAIREAIRHVEKELERVGIMNFEISDTVSYVPDV